MVRLAASSHRFRRENTLRAMPNMQHHDDLACRQLINLSGFVAHEMSASLFLFSCGTVVKALALSTFPQGRRRADSAALLLCFVSRSPFLVVAAKASLTVEDGVASVLIMPDLDRRLDEMRA